MTPTNQAAPKALTEVERAQARLSEWLDGIRGPYEGMPRDIRALLLELGATKAAVGDGAGMTAVRLEGIERWCDGDDSPDPDPDFESIALGTIRQLVAEIRRLARDLAAVTLERDEAQSLVTAWQDVFQSIEAHIRDRMAMKDEASPETYLCIIHSDIASVITHSKQISTLRWHDYAQHKAQLTTAESQLAAARAGALEEAARLVCGWAVGRPDNVRVACAGMDLAIRALQPSTPGAQSHD